MGTVDPESFDTLHSYANAFEMPFLTPWSVLPDAATTFLTKIYFQSLFSFI
jgi:hypothetical protein